MRSFVGKSPGFLRRRPHKPSPSQSTQRKAVWNSLEASKLLVSLATPLFIFALGLQVKSAEDARAKRESAREANQQAQLRDAERRQAEETRRLELIRQAENRAAELRRADGIREADLRRDADLRQQTLVREDEFRRLDALRLKDQRQAEDQRERDRTEAEAARQRAVVEQRNYEERQEALRILTSTLFARQGALERAARSTWDFNRGATRIAVLASARVEAHRVESDWQSETYASLSKFRRSLSEGDYLSLRSLIRRELNQHLSLTSTCLSQAIGALEGKARKENVFLTLRGCNVAERLADSRRCIETILDEVTTLTHSSDFRSPRDADPYSLCVSLNSKKYPPAEADGTYWTVRAGTDSHP